MLVLVLQGERVFLMLQDKTKPRHGRYGSLGRQFLAQAGTSCQVAHRMTAQHTRGRLTAPLGGQALEPYTGERRHPGHCAVRIPL